MIDSSARSNNTGKLILLFRIYFFFVISGGLITLNALFKIPTEANNIAFGGFSRVRLLMISGILIVIFFAFGFLLSSWFSTQYFTRFAYRAQKISKNHSFFGWCVLFGSLIFFGSVYFTSLTPEITEPFTQAYFIRLSPIITWTAALSLQTLIVLPLLHFEFNLKALEPQQRIILNISSTFSLLLFIWFLIAQTKIGITSSDAGAGWNALGTPLLEIQIFAAWVIAISYIGLALLGEKHREFIDRFRYLRILRIDLVISIILWIAAVSIWNSIPLTPNWYAASPRLPNQAIYPNSDAYLYDTTGQTLLTGEGLKTGNAPFAIRPLYALFLAGLHTLGGPDYESITWMQVAILAMIPVILYWITRNIHNRISGLIAASLLIFREANAIILGSSITTSHSKLLMADLPTTLGVMLFVLIMIRWLQNPAQRLTLTLIAGGLTGAFMLIRPEFAILLPVLGLAAFFQLNIVYPRLSLHQKASNSSYQRTNRQGRKIWVTGMLLIMIGLVFSLLPWIWRNYQITGTIFLDSPHYRSDLFAQRYQEYTPNDNSNDRVNPEVRSTPDSQDNDSLDQIPGDAAIPSVTPTSQIAYQPNEDAEEFAGRMFQNALHYASNNLPTVIYFITNHFMNSQVQTVLYLPATIRLPDSLVEFLGHRDPTKFWEECCSAEGYIRRLPFWFKWDGHLPSQSTLLLVFNLFVISVGIVCSWNHVKFIALLPLSASIGYSFINALVRNSGGRYILPIDWISMLYFAIGLGQITIWIVTYFRGSQLPNRVMGPIKSPVIDSEVSIWNKTNLVVIVFILLIGCILPISEKIIPPRYSPELQAERQNQLAQNLDFSVDDFLNQGGSILQGRALYPRFHNADQGETGTRRTPFSPQPFSRFDLYLVGPYNGGVILPLESSPNYFPNGSDVLAIGCLGEDYFDALVVVTYDPMGNLVQIFSRDPFPKNISCPMQLPVSSYNQ